MAFFSKLFKKTQEPERIEPSVFEGRESDSCISAVLYNTYTLTDPAKLLERYNNSCEPKMRATQISSDGQTITFEILNQLGFISFMPAPYPWSDLEGPCSTSWMWPDAAKELKDHQGHILISLLAKDVTQLYLSKIVSNLTLSVLEEVVGLGVYWANAALVIKRKTFTTAVSDTTLEYPLLVWIDFRFEKHKNGALNLITYGLHQFGIMEIEIINSKRKFEELLTIAMEYSKYLMNHGNIIKNGDTIGPNEHVRFKVTHRPSVWEDSEREVVLRFDL